MAANEKRSARNRTGETSCRAVLTSTKVAPQTMVFAARAASAAGGDSLPGGLSGGAAAGSGRCVSVPGRALRGGTIPAVVWAPPPDPPAPIATAGIPSESGMLASVEEQSRCERMPRCASTARRCVQNGGIFGQRGGRARADLLQLAGDFCRRWRADFPGRARGPRRRSAGPPVRPSSGCFPSGCPPWRAPFGRWR